jgi:hypothetical protein
MEQSEERSLSPPLQVRRTPDRTARDQDFTGFFFGVVAVDEDVVGAVDVLVDDVVLVAVDVLAISASACLVAVCAAVVESTPDFSVWMDWPRLFVGAGEVTWDGSTMVILPSGPTDACSTVPSGLTLMPVICSFSWSKETPRFFDTLVAATNCPRFLNPYAAW